MLKLSHKVIIFGPWVGEFTFEISWWAPEIRLLRNTKYKDYKAIHVGYIGRHGIYKDFVDEYIPFTQELHDSIDSPDCYLVRNEDDERSGIQMPRNIWSFYEDLVNNYKQRLYMVEAYTPMDNPIDFNIGRAQNPIGEYRHLSTTTEVDMRVKTELQQRFDNDRDIIAINARSRYRRDEDESGNFSSDGEDWNPDHWKIFIDRIINEMKLNVALFGIPRRGLYPGSLDMKQNSYLKSFVSEGKDSVDYQLALLKNTKCSIYGATGAVTLAFFANTPVFTQQSKDNGNRLNFEWQRKLTDNHKNVRIFDKYPMGQIYFSPVDELFQEFKKFYKWLGR